MNYEKKAAKIKARAELIKEKINLADSKRELRNIQAKSYEEMIKLPFLTRGVDYLEELFLGCKSARRRKMEEEFKENMEELPKVETEPEQDIEQIEEVEEPSIEQPSIFDDLTQHIGNWVSESL